MQRRLLIVALGLVVVLTLTGRGLAEEAKPHPTAEQLYKQFMKQVEAGQHEDARATYRRIDPQQLPREQRVTLYEKMQEVDQAGRKAATPESLLAQGASAVKKNQLSEAAGFYRAVLAHQDASNTEKAQAQAGLAEVRRKLNAGLSAARDLIRQAKVDLAAGRLDEADTKLKQVKAMGLDLGWFDNERVERLSQTVAEEQKKAAMAKADGDKADGDSMAKADGDKADGDTMAKADGDKADGDAVAKADGDKGDGDSMAKADSDKTDGDAMAKADGGKTDTDAADKSDGKTTDLLQQNAELVKSLKFQQLVAEGAQAESDRNYNVAVEKYEQALAIRDDDSLKARLSQARSKAEESKSGAQMGNQHMMLIEIAIQKTIAQYEQLMDRARKLMEEGKYSLALKEVEQAKNELDRSAYLPRDQYREKRKNTIELSTKIAEAEEAARIRAAEGLAEKAEAESTRQRLEAEGKTREQVYNLMRRANQLRREQKYNRALELLNQAAFLDPSNYAVEAMRDAIMESRLFVEFRKTRQLRRRKIQEQELEMFDATIPWTELMTFPRDWPELTYRRLSGLEQGQGESEASRRIRLKLQDPVPINFDGNKLVNVVEFLRTTTGVNIYVNWRALENAGVDRETLINLKLSNVPAGKALELVLEQASSGAVEPLKFAIRDDIVRISTEGDLRANVETRVYDIRDLLIQIPNFTNAPEFNLSSALSNVGGGGGGGGGGSFGGGGGGGSVFGGGEGGPEGRTRQELIDEIQQIIQDTVGKPEDWKNLGGRSDTRELNGNLIVRTTSENHSAVIQLLQQLREARAMQIHVEARFLIVTQNFLEEVGLDIDFNIPGTSPWGDIKIGQDSFGMTARPTGSIPGSFGVAADAVAAVGLGAFDPDTGFEGTGRALDFQASVLDDVEVTLLLRATKAHRQAISLSAPRVTFFNGQTAYVMIVTQTSFVSDLEPVPDADGFDPTLSIVNSGVVLQVTGTISADRRYVTLTVEPRLARLANLARVEQRAANNDNNNNGLLPPDGDHDNDGVPNDEDPDLDPDLVADPDADIVGFIQAPELELTEIRTTVSVPDKGTLLIGGQRLVTEVEIEAGVPILDKIPVLNRLFANRTTLKDERTLLILIKPTIIIQSEEEERNFPGLLQNPLEYNVGRNVAP